MCGICRMEPCHPKCPNAEDDAVFICSGCGGNIADGEPVWNVMGEQFCEDCIDSCKSEATFDDCEDI